MEEFKITFFFSPRILPRDTELSGWSVYDFHEEFARQQVCPRGDPKRDHSVRSLS